MRNEAKPSDTGGRIDRAARQDLIAGDEHLEIGAIEARMLAERQW